MYSMKNILVKLFTLVFILVPNFLSAMEYYGTAESILFQIDQMLEKEVNKTLDIDKLLMLKQQRRQVKAFANNVDQSSYLKEIAMEYYKCLKHLSKLLKTDQVNCENDYIPEYYKEICFKFKQEIINYIVRRNEEKDKQIEELREETKGIKLELGIVKEQLRAMTAILLIMKDKKV